MWYCFACCQGCRGCQRMLLRRGGSLALVRRGCSCLKSQGPETALLQRALHVRKIPVGAVRALSSTASSEERQWRKGAGRWGAMGLMGVAAMGGVGGLAWLESSESSSNSSPASLSNGIEIDPSSRMVHESEAGNKKGGAANDEEYKVGGAGSRGATKPPGHALLLNSVACCDACILCCMQLARQNTTRQVKNHYQYVIIGAGTTAYAAIETIFNHDAEADILIISEEAVRGQHEEELHGSSSQGVGVDARLTSLCPSGWLWVLLQSLPQPDIFRHHSLSTSLLHSYNEWRRHITSKLESEPDAYRYGSPLGGAQRGPTVITVPPIVTVLIS